MMDFNITSFCSICRVAFVCASHTHTHTYMDTLPRDHGSETCVTHAELLAVAPAVAV